MEAGMAIRYKALQWERVLIVEAGNAIKESVL